MHIYIYFAFILLIESFGYPIYRKFRLKNYPAEEIEYSNWFSSEIHELILGIGSFIFTLFKFEKWPPTFILEEPTLYPDSYITLIISAVFILAFLVSSNIIHKTKSFYSTETGGHVKAFFDSTLKIVNRNVASLDDPIIREVGYLKIGNLIKNYKKFEDGEIPILNLDHFLEIWKVITETTRPLEVKVIEFLPADIHWSEYDDVEPFYDGLQKLSRSGIMVDRTIYTQDYNSWDEDFASHIFSQIADSSEHQTKVGVSAKQHNRIHILVLYNKKCYMINYQEPLSLIGMNSFVQDESDFVSISKKTDECQSTFRTLYDSSVMLVEICRDNIFSKILDADRFGDAKKYYKLYSEVYKLWEDNGKVGLSDICGVDTSMLSNDIQDWLNKAFYRRILEDNGNFSKKLKDKNKYINRIFVLSEKMRETKIPIVKKIVISHLKKGLRVGLLDINWLIYSLKNNQIEKHVFEDLRDFNLMPEYKTDDNNSQGISFEICGLRRMYDENNGFEKFKVNFEYALSYPYWKQYDSHSEEYAKILSQWENLSKFAIWFYKANELESELVDNSSKIIDCYESLDEHEKSVAFYRAMTDSKIKLEKLLQIIAIKEPDNLAQKQYFE